MCVCVRACAYVHVHLFVCVFVSVANHVFEQAERFFLQSTSFAWTVLTGTISLLSTMAQSTRGFGFDVFTAQSR